MPAAVSFRSNTLQHTLGHLDCPACQVARLAATGGYLDPELSFADAAQLWLDARTLPGGASRARYVSPRTLQDDGDYIAALQRFFSCLRLSEIHVGHLRQYQEMRSRGELGVPEETVVARCAKQYRLTVEELRSDAERWAVAQARVQAARRPVGPVKINQELGLLCRILKRAQLWTPELEDCYQPLRIDPPDVPRALSPEEQQRFLEVAASREEWRLVYWYALLAFETTASNCEMRSLRLGDLNLFQQVLMVRSAGAKNRFRVRTIPLSENALWAAHRLHERALALGSASPEDCLFPFGERRNHYNPRKPMTNSGIKTEWGQVRRAACLRWFRIHDLRHTAITRMAEAGVPIAIIMSLAGHISPRMSQHYTQISEAAKRKALDDAFGKRKRPEVAPHHLDARPLKTAVGR
jgi:integrase